MNAARERAASLVRLGWGPERFRAAADELRASCSSVHVGWGLEVARHELADKYEAEAERLERAARVVSFRYRIDTVKHDGTTWMGVGYLHGTPEENARELDAMRGRRLARGHWVEVTIREATDDDEAAWNAYLEHGREASS